MAAWRRRGIVVSNVIKLSSPGTHEFWEVEVLFEDEHLLALNKPARLLTSPDRYDPQRPNLMKLLHAGIEESKGWARERALTYLMNAHRLDFETSGIILLAKNKPTLVALVNLFGSEKPLKIYAAFVQGSVTKDEMKVEAKLAPHPLKLGLTRVDSRNGKSSRTDFKVRERFKGYTLLECHPLTGRTHQIRVHLQFIGYPILGDSRYGGPPLLLSHLKSGFRLKPNKTERPLISTVALHAEKLTFVNPMTGREVSIEAPWPKDLAVALKYLRRYAAVGGQ